MSSIRERLTTGSARTSQIICTVVTLSVTLLSCSRSPDLVRIIESDVIDSLLAAAPQTLVDLDARPAQEWDPDMELGHPQDSLVLGRGFTFVIAFDSLYIADRQVNAIFVADLNGILHRQTGQEGEGPGEFDGLNDLIYSNGYFLAGDFYRLQILSDKLEYVSITDPLGRDAAGPGQGLKASATHLYSPCSIRHPFRVCPRRALPPYEAVQPFLPSTNISQPPMDGTLVGVTPSGQYVFAAFEGFPYLFVFNADHEHIHTIRFFGESVQDQAQNYELSSPGIPGQGLRTFIWYIHVLNDEYIAVPLGNGWHLYFIRILSDGRFEHSHTVQLNRPSTDDSERRYIRGDVVRLHGEHLYVSSTVLPHILRYPFQIR